MYIVQSELDFRGITTTTTKHTAKKCSVDDTVDVILKVWPLSMRDDSGVVPSFISTPLEFPQSSNPTQLNQTWV